MIQTLFSHSMATKTPQKSLNSDTIPDFSHYFSHKLTLNLLNFTSLCNVVKQEFVIKSYIF